MLLSRTRSGRMLMATTRDLWSATARVLHSAKLRSRKRLSKTVSKRTRRSRKAAASRPTRPRAGGRVPALMLHRGTRSNSTPSASRPTANRTRKSQTSTPRSGPAAASWLKAQKRAQLPNSLGWMSTQSRTTWPPRSKGKVRAVGTQLEGLLKLPVEGGGFRLGRT